MALPPCYGVSQSRVVCLSHSRERDAPHGIPPEGSATSQHRPQQWTHKSTGHGAPQTPPSLGGLVKTINKSTTTLPQQHLQIPDKDM